MMSAPAVSDQGERSTTADLLVVGSGVAGLASALSAARAGLRVAVLDAQADVGGASAISGGGCCIIDTPLQRELGISDSVELALHEWAAVSEGRADLRWAERYLSDSREHVWDYLLDLGINWQPTIRRYPDNSVARWHRPEGGGGAVITAHRRALDDYGVTWLMSTRLEQLHPASDAVAAVVRGYDGSVFTIYAEAVVMATGGFANSPELIDAVLTRDEKVAPPYLTGGGPDATGDGHRILDSLGARMVNLDNLWFYPVGVRNYRYPGSRRGVVIRGVLNDVWINDNGDRFHDESDRGGRSASTALRAQPGSRCWGVLDSTEIRAVLILDDGYFGTTEHTVPSRLDEFLDESSSVVTALTLGELALKMGVDATRMLSAIDSLNGNIASGAEVDPVTGRSLTALRSIATAPYYAIQYELIVQKTFGGVETDQHCRVVDVNGVVVPRLYAAGELAGMAGGRINGTGAIEGTMFGPCVYSGQLAGVTVAADLAQNNQKPSSLFPGDRSTLSNTAL
jgi:predicted oxidoreductase